MELITLRTLDVARRFPQELPESAATKERGREHLCQQHGVRLTPTLVTTYGDAGDPAVWRAYPLAVDAWWCAKGEHIEYALLTLAEVQHLLARGGAAAQSGNLDEAETCFRRVTSSWPGYSIGRVNLGSVYLDRGRAEQARGGDAVDRYRDVALDQLQRAVACKPPPPHRVWLMLANIHLRAGQTAQVKAVLADLARQGELDAATKEGMASFLRDAEALERGSRAPSTAPPAPALPGPTLEHSYVKLTLPHGWKNIEAPDGIFAMFEGPNNEIVNVVIMEAPAPTDTRATLARIMEFHEEGIRKSHVKCDVEPAESFDPDPTFLESRRRFFTQASGPPWKLFARYAITKGSLVMRDGRQVHAFLQIVHYGQAWDESTAVPDAIAAATLFPAVVDAERKHKASALAKAAPVLAPYFVTAAVVAQRDALLRAAGQPAEGSGDLYDVGFDGEGLFLTIAEETESKVQPLFGPHIQDRGLDFDEAFSAARERVGALVSTPELPVRVFDVSVMAIPAIWQPGMHAVVQGMPTTKVLVVGPSWMAASAASCPELFDIAKRALGTSRLRLLVPHRDRCFVFAEKSEEASRMLAEGIVRAEKGKSHKPLSDSLYWLWPSGLETITAPPSLEDILFAAALGEPRQQVEARWLRPDDWQWDEARGMLTWRLPPTLAPFLLRYEMPRGVLRALRLQVTCTGNWAAFERLDELVRAWLPSFSLREPDGTPWALAAARPQLEKRGTLQMSVARTVESDLGKRGWLFGKVFALMKDGQETYGFDLGFHPGGRPPG